MTKDDILKQVAQEIKQINFEKFALECAAKMLDNSVVNSNSLGQNDLMAKALVAAVGKELKHRFTGQIVRSGVEVSRAVSLVDEFYASI